jgi:Secretion system C-terminal sorting domain
MKNSISKKLLLICFFCSIIPLPKGINLMFVNSLQAENPKNCVLCDGVSDLTISYDYGDGTHALAVFTLPSSVSTYLYIVRTDNIIPSQADWENNASVGAPVQPNVGAAALSGLSLGSTYRFYIRTRCGTVGNYDYGVVGERLYIHRPTCVGLDPYSPYFNVVSTSYTTIRMTSQVAVPGLDSYVFQFSTTPDFATIFKSSTLPINSLPTNFTGFNPNTTYFVRYRPVCDCNSTCAFQNLITPAFTTLDCNPPTINTISFSTATQATLYFNAPVNLINISSYEYAVTNVGATPSVGDWISTATAGAKTLSGLVLYQTYDIHVRSVCSDYNTTDIIQSYTHNPPCTTPTSLSATAEYTTGGLSFTVPAGATWLSQVEYQVSTSADFAVGTIAASGTVAKTASPIALSGLTTGTYYYVRMRSVCPVACSSICDWATTNFSTLTCYEPSQLTQRANNTSRLVFHWLSSGAGIGQEYVLSNTATSAVVRAGNLGASDVDLTIEPLSLTAGTEYTFKVRTQCSGSFFSAYTVLNFTACNAPTTLPYSIDFSTYATDVLPCSWESQGDMMNEGWRVGPSLGFGPLVNRLLWAQDLSDGDWAYSPNLNFSVGNYELLLDFSTIQSGASSKFQVYLTDSYDPSVFTVSGTKIFEHLANSADRTNLGIPFTVGSAGQKHLVFHGEQGVQVIDIRKLTVRAAPAASDLSVAEYGNDDVCQTFYAHNVSGNGWYHIYNNSGEVLASLNPLGAVNLGTVTLQLRDASAVERYTNAAGTLRHVLPRHFSFSSSAIAHGVAFGSSVQVRLYFSEAEMTALRTASGIASLTPSNITITHFSPPTVDCDIANNLGVGTAEVVVATAATAIAGGNHCLQFGVSHFSEFTPHTPSATPLSATVLPLELLSFQGKLLDNNTTSLAWTTANVSKVAHFDIERSVNGIDFTKIGTVKIEKNENSYAFTDNLLAGATTANTLYYRLKINDLDGSSAFSKVISFEKSKALKGVKIYPNPATDALTVENAEGQAIEIVNVLGQVVLSVSKNIVHYPLSIIHLKSGVYFLKTGGETVRFIKN